MIYGLVALSLVLMWRSTGVLNFAQGAMPMFATYVGMVVLSLPTSGTGRARRVAIVAGFVMGGVDRALLVRRLYGKPEINPIVVMVGFLIVLESVAAAIWSLDAAEPAQSPFSVDQLAARRQALRAFALHRLRDRRRSGGHDPGRGPVPLHEPRPAAARVGGRARGLAPARRACRAMLTLGWVLSTGVGVVAAILVSSNFFTGLTPQVMDGIFAFGFIAAAIGGLESPVGAIVAGVTLGIACSSSPTTSTRTT